MALVQTGRGQALSLPSAGPPFLYPNFYYPSSSTLTSQPTHRTHRTHALLALEAIFFFFLLVCRPSSGSPSFPSLLPLNDRPLFVRSFVLPIRRPAEPPACQSIMADNKKNDDFVANMPDNGIGDGDKENDSLVGRGAGTDAIPPPPAGFLAKMENSGPFSIMAYCASSISMTVVNKYVVSGTSWNLTFFYLAIQVRSCPSVASCAHLTCPVHRLHRRHHSMQVLRPHQVPRSPRPRTGQEVYVARAPR